MFVGRTMIAAPHGQLEAIYTPAQTAAERVALILHPHPLYGGTMHNKVVYHTAKALGAAGFATLRFNFRGVAASSGSHDAGRGEVDDARTALDFLLEREPAARAVLVAGFSFGAAVGLRFGCADRRVGRLIAIGTPARWLDPSLLVACAKPIGFIHGANDTVAPLAALEDILRPVGPDPSRRLQVIAAADHFFEGALPALRNAVTHLAAD